MPELPEVQAHAERLTAEFGGAVLERFTAAVVHRAEDVRPRPRRGLRRSRSTRVGRRGKFLLARLRRPSTFVVHLMQGGRLSPTRSSPPKPRGGLARWRFDDGRALLLTEAGKEQQGRRLGGRRRPAGQAPLDRLGLEADVARPPTSSRRARRRRTMRLHGFLRDQHGLAGLGRMLANEICHTAKLSPFAMTAKLTADEIDRLARGHPATCIADGAGLRADARRHVEVGGPPRRGAPPQGRAVPGLRRHHPGGRVQRLRGRLLPHLPDRRQGPGRQHDVQVPQVGRVAGAPDGLEGGPSLRRQIRPAQMRPSSARRRAPRPARRPRRRCGPGEVVDVEALDDLVLAVRAR